LTALSGADGDDGEDDDEDEVYRVKLHTQHRDWNRNCKTGRKVTA